MHCAGERKPPQRAGSLTGKDAHLPGSMRQDAFRIENYPSAIIVDEKVYFFVVNAAKTDSFKAGRPPDYTHLTEQQIGVALLRAHEAEEPGAIARQDALLYYRSATRAEIDFTAGWLDGVPYEGKYTEGAWLREAQTATAAYGRCVLATRNVTERVSDEKRHLLAIPAPMLALLIDPRPDTDARRV
jgi:hypothetical protein